MTQAEYAAWTLEWNRSLDMLDTQLRAPQISQGVGELPQVLTGQHRCSLIAVRHIAKTGGVSVRDWMLRLEQQGRGRFFGPVTWMKFRGRCDGRKRYLHCCHPASNRPVSECRQVTVTKARAAAVSEMAAAAAAAATAFSGSGHDDTSTAFASAARGGRGGGAVPAAARRLSLLEFHWPDSALGHWGEPHTFLQMLPRMRPHSLPGCRVVVTTVLRDPFTLYPSLQRHQYDAMRGYGADALKERCQCNLTQCDMLGFVRAFPNFQGWRLTSPHWLTPPLSSVGHDAMFFGASRLLARLDVVGVTERLEDFVQLVCERAGLRPCARVSRLNTLRAMQSTKDCAPPAPDALRAVVREHALADLKLHALATSRFEEAWTRRMKALWRLEVDGVVKYPCKNPAC